MSDGSFGPRLLELCNRGLLECLALNLHCLRGERAALGALLGDRIVSDPQPPHTPHRWRLRPPSVPTDPIDGTLWPHRWDLVTPKCPQAP